MCPRDPDDFDSMAVDDDERGLLFGIANDGDFEDDADDDNNDGLTTRKAGDHSYDDEQLSQDDLDTDRVDDDDGFDDE